MAGVDWKARAEAAERELERWRHGQQIEGDYVCPRDLEADALKTMVGWLTDALLDIPTTHAGRKQAWAVVDRAMKELEEICGKP